MSPLKMVLCAGASLATLRKDLEAAGFRLDSTAGSLANPRDDHSKAWFDNPLLKDNTDRLVHRYRSPD